MPKPPAGPGEAAADAKLVNGSRTPRPPAGGPTTHALRFL